MMDGVLDSSYNIMTGKIEIICTIVAVLKKHNVSHSAAPQVTRGMDEVWRAM